MKIIDSSKNRTFDKLAVGDVFTVNNCTGYYMRITNHMDSNDRLVNAVSLEYGNSFYFLGDTIVKKIDATLVIGAVPVIENQVVAKEENETKEESEAERLKKTTLAEIVEYCYSAQGKSCKGCPIYNYCSDVAIVTTFVNNLYTLFNE